MIKFNSFCFEQQPKDEACVLCEYVVQTLDSMLEDKTNRDQVKQALVIEFFNLTLQVVDQNCFFVIFHS
jgi:hypothetical protein